MAMMERPTEPPMLRPILIFPFEFESLEVAAVGLGVASVGVEVTMRLDPLVDIDSVYEINVSPRSVTEFGLISPPPVSCVDWDVAWSVEVGVSLYVDKSLEVGV